MENVFRKVPIYSEKKKKEFKIGVLEKKGQEETYKNEINIINKQKRDKNPKIKQNKQKRDKQKRDKQNKQTKMKQTNKNETNKINKQK